MTVTTPEPAPLEQRPPKVRQRGAASLFDPAIMRRASVDALRKLDPAPDGPQPGHVRGRDRQRLHDLPLLQEPRFARARPRTGSPAWSPLWLWFTVLFANFAEAVAEGRGKAQADTLRKTRSETTAFVQMPDGSVEERASSALDIGDLFAKAGVQPPATCEAFVDAAKKLTVAAAANGGTPQYGFGMRGGRGGQDNWGPFVLSQAAMTPAELGSPKAVAANQMYVDLMRKDKSVPPSAPNDGFNEIINGFKSGQTAMIFHHIGSSKTMHDTHGDKVSAVPVPACGGKRWTSFGDESNALFKQSKVKDAAWKWMSYLSGEGNVKFVGATGQMTVTKSGVSQVAFQPRFAKATSDSLPFAAILPPVPQTSDFVSNVWPTNMQRALNGEITSAQMMEAIAKHYATK